MEALTLDAAPLIGLERDPARARELLTLLLDRDTDVIVSAATVAEVWRGGSRGARMAHLLAGAEIEPVDEAIARRAGELLGQTESSATLDAIVVATAEVRGTPVLTADVRDIAPLAEAADVDVLAF